MVTAESSRPRPHQVTGVLHPVPDEEMPMPPEEIGATDVGKVTLDPLDSVFWIQTKMNGPSFAGYRLFSDRIISIWEDEIIISKNLKSSAIKGDDFAIQNMITVRENSEVVIVYPDEYFNKNSQ